MSTLKYLGLLVAVGILALAACAKTGPEPITYGKDNCANCGMIMSDRQFGAELITDKGKVMKFDSVECLAQYLHKKEPKVGSLWVVDANEPGRLVRATSAWYLQSEKVHSPMGLNLAAFGLKEAATATKGNAAGTILTWDDVLNYVKQKWS